MATYKMQTDNNSLDFIEDVTTNFSLENTAANHMTVSGTASNVVMVSNTVRELTITNTSASTYPQTTNDDVIICDTSSNAVEVDLLAVASARDIVLTIVRNGGNNVTVDPNGSEEINGGGAGTPYTLSSDRDTIRIIQNGTEWFII